MSRLIIDAKDEEQLQELIQLLAAKGISFQSEEDNQVEKEMKARKELADWAESLPKYEITHDEIQSIVEEVRTERHDRKQKDEGHP